MKHNNTSYNNNSNNNIEGLTSKNIITIIAKTIKNIKLLWGEKTQKNKIK